MPLSKQALLVENNTNFPNNNSGLITPELLRQFNTDMIDAMQLTQSMSEYAVLSGSNTFIGNQTMTGNLNVSGVISASVLHVQYETASVIFSTGSNQLGDELTDIQTLSGSVKVQGSLTVNGVAVMTGSVSVDTGSLVTTASFNAYTQSTDLRLNSLETNSASVNVSISNLNTTTASLSTSITNINSFTQSQAALNGTFATTGSNTFTGNQVIDRASKLYTNGIYWTDVTAGFNNLEIINQGGGNLDLAALNGGKVRIVNTPLVLTGSALTSSNDISTSANIYAANLTGSATIPAGTISSSAQITSLGFVSSSVTASSLITASFSGNTLTFTKGDASTFGVVIPDVSGSTIDTGSFVTTSSFNAYTQSNDQRVSSLETNSASVNISISNINTFTQSANISINALNAATSSYATSAITASSLITASVSLNTITFTKGDASTFAITVNTGSGGGGSIDTGSFATTGSNTFTGTQIITGSMFVYNTGSGNRAEIMNGDISRFPQVYAQTLFPGTIQDDNGTNLLIKTNAGGATNGGFLVVNTVSGSQFTGSVAVQGNIDITGQYLINGTPISGGANINTGSFATTGSNTFNGDQIVNGKLTISSSANSYLQFTSPNSATGSGQIFFGQNGPYIQTYSDSNPDNQGLQLVGGLSGSFALATRYGGQNAKIDLDALADQSNPAASRGRIQVKTNGQIDLSGYGGGITISGSQTTIQGLTYPSTDGTNGQVLTTNGSGVLTFTTVSGGGGGATLGANTFTGSQVITNGSLQINQSGPGTSNFSMSGSQNNLTFTAPSTFFQAGGAFIFNNNYTNGGSGSLQFSAVSSSAQFYSTNGLIIGRATLESGPLGNGFVKMNTISGSLVLAPSGFSVDAATLLHLSSSSNTNFVNLIFKSNSNAADTIISGSNNIFVNPNTPTAGFKRYVGGNNNIINTVAAPQISGSMQFSPSMNGNYIVSGMIMRGPVSSSAWNINNNNFQGTVSIGVNATLNAEKLTGGLAMASNNIAGTLSIIANQTALTGSTTAFNNNTVAGGATLNLSSSAASMTFNIINDNGFTLTNQFFSSSAGLGLLAVNRNNIAGQNNSIIVVGAQPTGTTTGTSFSDNFIGGGSNIVYGDIANARVSGVNAYHQVIRNIVFGNNLIITGSGLLSEPSTLGSAFFGRYNSTDGTKDLTNETIFAVGTGNSTTRKTGFLIDSGSNSYFEGTLNVLGSSTFTGSLNGLTLTRGSGSNNTGLGVNVLQNAVSGGNVAIGANALQLNTSGTDNIALGDNALQQNISGDRNMAIGSNTLDSNTTGTLNVAIGNATLSGLVDGSANVGIGFEALKNQTTSNDNVGIGKQALNQNISGSSNIAIGAQAGYNETGSGNFYINNTQYGSINADRSGSLMWGKMDTTTANQTLQINAATTITDDLIVYGNKQFNVGAFSSLVTQSGSANVSQSMNFEVTDKSEGVSIASNSQITLTNSGTYNIQFSAQLLADTGADDVYIWLKKNGTNVAASAGHVVLANNEELIAAWNYVVDAAASDYFEIVWQSTNGDAILLTETATGNIPSIPSVILTVTQVR